MKKIHLPKRRVEIAYEDTGSGDTLLLLHAFPFDREMWQPQIEGLSSAYRVLAPDLPGFGDSTALTEAYTVESLADVMADFLDAIGVTGTAIVLGLSMGGYVALAFARRQPQRLRSLILADTRSEPDDQEAKANRDRAIAVVNENGVAALMDVQVGRLLGEQTRKSRPEIVERVKRIGSRQKPAVVVQALLALRERPDATPGLEQITVPTLVLVGEQDALTPPAVAMSMADRILGATQVTILGAGHLSNLEAPQEFNEQVSRFLHHPKK